MKIGFDAKRITHNSTGLGNYARFVVNALSKYFPENNYILYSPSSGKEDLRNRIHPSPNIRFSYPENFLRKKFPAVWRSKGIMNDLERDKIDVYHGLSNELPLGLNKSKIPSVVTIHDLIFLRFPHYYKPADRAIYTYKFAKACRNANRIIATSEMTKKDIINFFGISEQKIQVVYQNCDAVFQIPVTETQKQQIRETYNLPARYVLNVGSVEERKNVLLLMKALRYLDDDVCVVVVGAKTKYTEKVRAYISQNNLLHRVKIFHGVPFAHLPALYQMASTFVYPSVFEGFGIPVIESLYSGVPVIAATGSCLEEAGGPHSVYVDPHEESQLAAAIEKVLSDKTLAETMVLNGKKYVQKFSDEKIAAQLQHVYNEVAGS